MKNSRWYPIPLCSLTASVSSTFKLHDIDSERASVRKVRKEFVQPWIVFQGCPGGVSQNSAPIKKETPF